MTDVPETKRSYFDHVSWVADAVAAVATFDRDPGNPELAHFGYERLKDRDLCDSDEEWLILTNRLVASPSIRVEQDRGDCVHFQRHMDIRAAISELREGLRLDVGRVAARVGLDVGIVRAVVNNMIKKPFAETMVGALWIEDDVVKMSSYPTFVGAGMQFPRPRYPEVPLIGLYDRVGTVSGSGKTGSVVPHTLVHDTTWGSRGQRVAVKLIDGPPLVGLNRGQEVAETRLLREFRTGRSHRSQRLVRTYDVFRTSLPVAWRGGDSDLYGLVMDLVDGKELGAEGDTLPASERLRRLRELTEAVAELHALGSVHRDIKPTNVIVRSDGRVVLVDYGIAKTLDDHTVTASNASIFTERYAAPEQIRHPDQEHAEADVYALGVTIWEVMMSKEAFTEIHPYSLLLRKEEGPLVLPPSAEWGADLESLVAGMTAPDPHARPSIAVVRARLAGEELVA